MRHNAETVKIMEKRSLIILLICAIAWIALIVRLFYLQVIEYDTYQNAVIDNVLRENSATADRGLIYDCNMVPIATNVTVWRVFISPRDIEDQNQAILISTKLSEITGVDYNYIYERTQKTNRADETIKRKVYEEEANQILALIDEHELTKQIHLEASTTRYYPYGSLASTVIGIVGTDGGLFGLEYQYDDYLSGSTIKYITAKSGSGLSMPYKYDTATTEGTSYNAVSTIDITVQNMLENQLRSTYENSNPLNRVTGIVMDVKTGAIKAMGVYPSVDLNSPYTLDADSQEKLDNCGFAEDSKEYNEYYWQLVYSLWKNKAVSELYEPGSTFKIITTAIGIEEGATTFDDVYYCSGALKLEGYGSPIHCHKRSGHGRVTYAEGLQQSCNPTLMQLAMKIGRSKFYEYFDAFGFKDITGIDLPGESYGLYSEFSSFSQVSLAVYSFGQTFKTTALQELTAISAIANGGYLVTPYVIESVVDDDGNAVYTHETDIKRQIISTEVCKSITSVLEQGVSGNGGARNAYVTGYKVAAKTGTSEVRDVFNEAGETYLRIGSCVAYAPADDPQYAVIIIVDSPQSGNVYGSTVAAPYVSKFLNEFLPYMGIERTYTDEELANLSVSIRDYRGYEIEDAKNSIINLGLDYVIVGEGDTVTNQIPSSGSSINKNSGKVYFYCGEASPESTVPVPDVKGRTGPSANKEIINSGLNINIIGATNHMADSATYVVEQSPAAGEVVPTGTVVTVELRYTAATDD